VEQISHNSLWGVERKSAEKQWPGTSKRPAKRIILKNQ
jgi:hypothetical protein